MDVKAWCPTLWDKHKLRKIFGPTEEEIGEKIT